ncbi:hypothetical protein Acr_00g0006190 [Actinidia rufa]|uniref:Uncharacterized protein n=1 Tax=Actinidia rufa TaxID=165716 RepID=A0A7J0D7Y8_9ERIC|nr:hypothetical protein Acr_00g0006190 [Actinidia rufa]
MVAFFYSEFSSEHAYSSANSPLNLCLNVQLCVNLMGHVTCVGAVTCLFLIGWLTTVSPQNVAVQVHALPFQMPSMAVYLALSMAVRWPPTLMMIRTRVDDLRVLSLGPSATEMDSRQWKVLVIVPLKIVSSLSRAELDARCRLIRLCCQKLCSMKLLLGRIQFLFKATNSLVVDKQCATVLPVSDIANFNLCQIKDICSMTVVSSQSWISA